ncbi:hypothetical protein CF326_g5514 [Tilletia indica]|nr:hypothetical protein CF326_g5514 [Tilletia indica]
MRRKRALEGGREYTCLVSLVIGTSLPPVNKKAEQALRAATHMFSTRVKTPEPIDLRSRTWLLLYEE